MAIVQKWVPYSQRYLFNAIPDTKHNANPTNPNPTNPTNTCTADLSSYILHLHSIVPAVIASVSAIVHAPKSSSYWSCGHYCKEEEEPLQ